MKQELTISVSQLLPTKENIGTVASTLIDLCRAGEINPVELAVKLSALEKVCALAREGINEQVLTELGKENGKTVKLGAKVERREVGVKWDYTRSTAWVKNKEEQEKANLKVKEIEKMAQMIPEGTEAQIVDKDTGEVLIVTRGTKTSKTSFAVTLSNES